MSSDAAQTTAALLFIAWRLAQHFIKSSLRQFLCNIKEAKEKKVSLFGKNERKQKRLQEKMMNEFAESILELRSKQQT